MRGAQRGARPARAGGASRRSRASARSAGRTARPTGTSVTHAMQPRQRSKCSTTVSVSGIEPSTSAGHQVDPPARRVHLLVPQRVRRARRQAEAAVDAVGDQLGLHIASTTRSASGLHARLARLRDVRDPRPRAHERRRPRRPSARDRAAPPAARAARPTDPPPRRRARAAALSTDALRSLEQHVHACRRRGRPRSARAASGAARCQRCASTTVRAAAGSGCRRSASCSTLPSRPARAAEELAEVVAGDVLHDLAARVRARAVGQHAR